jgi:ATP-binding cassette, subfamily B, bacterial
MSDYKGFEEEAFDKSFNGDTLLRILSNLRPHWRSVLGFLIAISLVAFVEAAMTYINALIIDQGIIARDTERLSQLVLIYGLLVVVMAVGVFSFIFLAGRLGHQVTYELRKRMFDHLQRLSLSYYNRTPVGWIMSRITSDSERISELVSWGLLDITWAIVNITMALIFMVTINWQLTLIVAPLIPILVVLAAWFKGRILIEYRTTRKTNSRITGNYNEMIVGVRVIKALNREETSLEEFGQLTREMYGSSYRAAWYSALFLPTVQVISSVVVGAIILVGGLQISTTVGAGLTIGGLSAFIGYITFMLWPVQDIARVYASMQQAIASAERSFSLLDTAPEVVNRHGAIDPGTIRGEIVFDNVTFYYDPEQPVLANFNLRIQPGETIALVGHTGSGKSTIVNLLCRFYEPKAGVIRFGKHDYQDLTLDAIQSRIGVVLQTPHLFSGTIRENIAYGRLDASDDDVMQAARLTGAHDFIMHLENGYDEQVGEGGVLLSVGQKQLISLARAVISKPELFIMDEATSSVDTLTEHMLQRAMDQVMKDRTSVVIAHRLSTIKNADRIIVLEHGKIIEIGNHQELLRLRGNYHNLYTKQFRQEHEQAQQQAQLSA